MESLQKAPKKKKFKWRKSEAKCIIVEDLVRRVLSLETDATNPEEKWESYYKDLPENKGVAFERFKETLEKNAMTAEEAWEKHYKKLPAFEDVKFEQFRDRLKDHRKQVKAHLRTAMEDEKIMLEDRKLYPKAPFNGNGTPKWPMHQAKFLLQQDMDEKKHLEMKPRILRETRDEYKMFTLDVFRGHIYQQKRANRFILYLNDNREQKKKIHSCKPPVGADDDTMARRMAGLGLHDQNDTEEVQELITVRKGPESQKRIMIQDNSSSPNKRKKL